MYIHQGKGIVIVNNREYMIEKNKLFIFQPFHLHRTIIDADCDHPYIISCFHFDPLYIGNLLSNNPNLHFFYNKLWKIHLSANAFSLPADSSNIIKAISDYCDMAGKHDTDDYYTAAILMLLNYIKLFFEKHIDKTANHDLKSLSYTEIAMQWLENHIDENFSLNNLARSMYLNPNYVSNLFKNAIGMSLTQYLKMIRINRASFLLTTTLIPLYQVAINIGINNMSYFSQLLKNETGQTPKQIRKSINHIEPLPPEIRK
jgi:AraC-like DNA-binding protein